MADLRLCPCCGGDAEQFTEDFGKKVWVQCTVCGVQTSRYDADVVVDGKDGKAWADLAWNRRVRNG